MKCLFYYIFLHLALQAIFGKSSKAILDSKPAKLDVLDGDNVSLPCVVAEPNSKQYNISWTIGGKLIKNNQRRYQVGNDLYFRPINKDLDDGKFQCIATDLESGAEYESNSKTFNFTWVRVGGVSLKRPTHSSSIRSSMKSSIVFKCNITGNPQPKNFTWFVNQKRIVSSSDLSLRKDRLSINHPRAEISDGVYTCCAETLVNENPICIPASAGYKLEVLNVGKPILVRPPADVVVNKGATASLSCVFHSDPPPTIIWRRKGSTRPLTNRPRSGRCERRCIYSNGTMVVRNVKRSVEGKYECVATQGDYKPNPVSASITLASIHPFDQSNVKRVVTLGRKFEYHCETPKALPSAQITWTRLRDNRTIDESNGHVTRLQNTLVIDNIERRDLGAYVCVAHNIAGTVAKNLVLTSDGETASVGELLPQNVDEGANVTWTCPLRGISNPVIKWLKDGAIVEPDNRKRVLVGLRLILLSVDTSDEGAYSCAVKSVLDNTQIRSNPATLLVNELFFFQPPLRGLCVIEGAAATVNCTVNKGEVGNFYWEKFNVSNDAFVQVKESPRTSQFRHGRVLSLVFNQTIRSDSQLYRCRAALSSKEGETQKKIEGVIKMTVVTPPRPKKLPQQITVFAGQPLMLNCGLNIVAKNTVFWNFSPSVVRRNGFSILPNGSLWINNTLLHHNGDYYCTYSNCGFKTVVATQLRVVKDIPSSTSTSLSLPEAAETSHTLHIIILSIAGGIAYVLCTIILLYYCKRKHRKKSAVKSEQSEAEKMINGAIGQMPSNCDDEVVSLEGKESYREASHFDPALNRLAYRADNISPVTVIGKGEFGDVFLSRAPGLFPDLEDDILVMVKAFDSDDEEKRCNFEREINILHQSAHDNIVKLLAVCFDGEQSGNIHYLITEYLEWGILKLCLEASKNKTIPKFTKQHKMMMCSQLACALDHLDSIGLRHGDVATRNCVVSSHLLVKLSVLGLAEEGFENEYYQVENQRLPLRWMAPEGVLEGRFSSKSDVWSFAVTCWEIFTQGQFPFEDLSNEDYLKALQSDALPILPPLEGSKRITSLIKKCCQLVPDDRPDINQIMRKLQSIIGSGDATDDVIKEQTDRTLTDDSDEKQRSDHG